MKKVIVKAKIASREKFEQKLTDIDLDFSPVYWQHDRVYVPRNYKNGMNLPRLTMRTEMRAVDKPAKYSLILRRHIEDSGVDIEAETLVRDYTEMIQILLQLGFKQQAEISKRRQEIRMGEGAVLYLDNVEGRNGYFAKLESDLLDGDTVSEVREDLTKTLSVLGEKNLINLPYFEV